MWVSVHTNTKPVTTTLVGRCNGNRSTVKGLTMGGLRVHGLNRAEKSAEVIVAADTSCDNHRGLTKQRRTEHCVVPNDTWIVCHHGEKPALNGTEKFKL